MDSETLVHPIISDSSTSPTRRSLIALVGVGALAGGLASLVGPESTDAKKKKKGKKKRGGKGKGKSKCTGKVNGSASGAEEEALLQMINDFRAGNGGLQPLARHPQLDNAAATHSRDMATRCYFEHVSPNGTNPFDRMAAAGYPGVPLSENIYKGSGSFASAAEAFDAWKNSDGHRTNMLDPQASQIGIGTALEGSGFMNWTNVFGRLRDI
jgi:uncharacterized protein YkwD